jgi:hypothetical protein
MFETTPKLPKKVFHLKKKQKAYTYQVRVEIEAQAQRVAASKAGEKEIEKEAKKLRAELKRMGWNEAVHPVTREPFLDLAEKYFKHVVKEFRRGLAKEFGALQ